MKTLILLGSLGIAAPADAGVYADALAKSDKGAIETLRAKKADIAARCTLGAVYAKRNDLPRANLYLAGCADAELPAEIAADIARLSRDVTKKLRESELSSIAIATKPDGAQLTAQISALPGETFTLPATIWVKAGTYELAATDGELTFKQTLTVGAFSRTAAIIDAQRKAAPPPRAGKADFSDEGAAEKAHEGPPPNVKRGSMMSKKYLGIAEAPAPGSALEDPMAVRHAASRPPRTLWLGVRLGGGMFDDGAGDARVGAAVAGTLRYALTPRYFLAGRFDWSRRGAQSIDVVGASAGAGATLAGGLAVIAQLRADLRDDTMDVNPLGASAVANLELALPATPITAGLRFEQGLTELAPGTRDRALLLEVGVDWR